MKPFPVLAMLFGFAVASPVNATIVFDNFGPGNSYIANTGWDIAGPASMVGTAVSAMQFSPSSSGFFSELTIALGFISPLPTLQWK